MAIAWGLPKIIGIERKARVRFWTPSRRRSLDTVAFVGAILAVVLAGFGAASLVDATDRVARIDAHAAALRSATAAADEAAAADRQAAALLGADNAALERQLADRSGIGQ